ncbi:hypothetical protein NQ318_013304 [Aromia moschata]|uniref:Acylglycerol lipase n=1 Tax=Aromia moschata TaxID=1265417 RepID=A0AAV8Y0W8_9CUCU|nr:hypothetical protein NQ318_013304 [Aromia moschata]
MLGINNNNRYNDYYLVNDLDMDEIGFDERPKKRCSRRCKIVLITVFLCTLAIIFLIIFVGLPLIFMNFITIQRILIFTHFNLQTTEEYFETYRLPAFKNKYITVKDLDGSTNQSLGAWQMLPVELAYKALHDEYFDYEKALLNSNYSVLIYFHGTGEDRSDNIRQYQLFRYYFHVIAFDYRSKYLYNYNQLWLRPLNTVFAEGLLSEKEVVNDCVQLYKWVLNKTNSPIYIWGHSLGSALATSTVAELENSKIYSKGLILESAFTSLHDELYVHPYGKIFSWLPWFAVTILNPLHKNGFIFNTASNILNISCPIMILHAQDDSIVPYQFGEKLYEIASNRSEEAHNTTFFYMFNKTLDYNHFFHLPGSISCILYNGLLDCCGKR